MNNKEKIEEYLRSNQPSYITEISRALNLSIPEVGATMQADKDFNYEYPVGWRLSGHREKK